MNKGSWLRFVIAGGLFAVLIPASAQAVPGFDQGHNPVPGKDRAAEPTCEVVGSTLMCNDRRADTTVGTGQPAADAVPASSNEGGIQAEWLYSALAVLVAGTGASIILMRKRPHALS